MERLAQIRNHLAPHSTWALAAPTAGASKDYAFPDEDESTFGYKDIPDEDKFPATISFSDTISKVKKFKLLSGEVEEVAFRTYVEGQDDEAFQRLDSECKQGSSGLETVFFLKEKWSSFQRNAECIVAYPVGDPKRIIATTRGVRKWVYLNGKPVPTTYHFMLRVDPRYRGCGLGHFTERILLYHDYEQGVRYIQGYVVPDNEKSLALQKRFTEENQTDSTDLKRWFVNGYSPEALINKVGELKFESRNFRVSRSDDVKIQVDHTKKYFGKTQLAPCDLSNIFRCKLSEGTYFLYGESANEPLASLSVWNSGAIRSSRLPGMKDFLETPCIFYNCWSSPALSDKEGQNALSWLIKSVAEILSKSKEHGYVYVFLLEDHPLAEFFRESAKFFIAWKARLYYWDAAFQHDPALGCETFFDPRDSLQ